MNERVTEKERTPVARHYVPSLSVVSSRTKAVNRRRPRALTVTCAAFHRVYVLVPSESKDERTRLWEDGRETNDGNSLTVVVVQPLREREQGRGDGNNRERQKNQGSTFVAAGWR